VKNSKPTGKDFASKIPIGAKMHQSYNKKHFCEFRLAQVILLRKITTSMLRIFNALH